MTDTFTVTYSLAGPEADARAMAEAICVEQTIEFPADLVWKEEISREIVARIDSLEPAEAGRFLAVVRFNAAIAGTELPQLLNVLFGNASILPGVRVETFDLPGRLLAHHPGPRFGRQGLRELFDAPTRPLLATAIKPMGLSPEELADLAGRFASGGMDIIKDDHGLADQAFSPFQARVAACCDAVARANRQTGGRSRYFPNVTGPADQLLERAAFARDAGAGGFLVAPGLCGFDGMRLLSERFPTLPVLAHPALLGSFVVSPSHGMSHYALFGLVHRLAGADAVIFPNHGGRFSFSETECRRLAEGTAAPLGQVRSIFPVPAGGMSLARTPEMVRFYGNDVMLLVGGDLHRHGPDLAENCRVFRRIAEESATTR
jgi:ribulose-bisphosphate carboxylase large chain